MFDNVIQWFLGQGWLGVVVLVLLACITYLWKQIEKKDERITELEQARVEQAEAYADHALTIQQKVFDNTTMLNGVVDKLTDVLKEKP